MMNAFGRFLVISGILMILAGAIFILGGHLPFHFGKLPGDIEIHRKNVHLYIPLASMLLISIFITVIINFLHRFLKK